MLSSTKTYHEMPLYLSVRLEPDLVNSLPIGLSMRFSSCTISTLFDLIIRPNNKL